jgi:hypothetical protein
MTYQQSLALKMMWDALPVDPKFALMLPSAKAQAVFRKYVEEVPQILADLLDQPVTVENLIKSRLAFVRYGNEHGLINEMVAASRVSDHAKLAAKWQGETDRLIESFTDMLTNLSVFMGKYGVTDEKVFDDMNQTFPEELRQRIRSGMTIGDLLLEKPSIILLNA